MKELEDRLEKVENYKKEDSWRPIKENWESRGTYYGDWANYLEAEENEKLQRFNFYYVIRREKYVRQGGDPTFGNLYGQEYTAEKFEYHLSHCLNCQSPIRLISL